MAEWTERSQKKGSQQKVDSDKSEWELANVWRPAVIAHESVLVFSTFFCGAIGAINGSVWLS